MNQAYPLKYPLGWKRTRYPAFASFGDHSLAKARDRLVSELNRLGAASIVLSTNIELRQDGLPYSNRRQPDDKGVCAYFKLDGVEQCFPCDRWNKIEHNMWAIMKSIEALRGLERWGAKDMVTAAFKGFQALPDYSSSGVDYFENCETLAKVEVAWKLQRRDLHPDMGGSTEEFSELNRQYEELKSRLA